MSEPPASDRPDRDEPGPPAFTGPVPASQGGERLLDLLRVQAALRAPDGCPWDREQTHASLAKHLLEETHELLEAIDAGDPDAIRDELGDVLLQVTFHAQIARETEGWDVDDVAQGLVAKLVHRHPHVFGDVSVRDADEVLVNWERLKAAEKGGRGSVEDDIPASLPALARASKVQRRAAGWGFDRRSVGAALATLREGVDDLTAAVAGEEDPEEAEARIGEVLFATAALARRVGVDPETALRRTTTRFAARFEAVRAHAEAEGVDLAALGDDELLAYARGVLEEP